jgi:hypothetical protein
VVDGQDEDLGVEGLRDLGHDKLASTDTHFDKTPRERDATPYISPRHARGAWGQASPPVARFALPIIASRRDPCCAAL